jgi:hypothetical protein
LNKDRITTGSFNEEDTLNGMAFDTWDTFFGAHAIIYEAVGACPDQASVVSVEKSGLWLNFL